MRDTEETVNEESEKERLSEVAIISTIICSFAIGLFADGIGVILYIFYDRFVRNKLIPNSPTKLKEWYESHSPLLYCLIGCVISLSINIIFLLNYEQPKESIW